MWFKHSMNIAQQLMPIYNITVHEKKVNVTKPLVLQELNILTLLLFIILGFEPLSVSFASDIITLWDKVFLKFTQYH